MGASGKAKRHSYKQKILQRAASAATKFKPIFLGPTHRFSVYPKTAFVLPKHIFFPFTEEGICVTFLQRKKN